MKQFSTVLNTILVCALVFTLLAFVLPERNARAAGSLADPTPSACDSSRSIQVSGTAAVNIAPDRVLIQLGVQSNGSTPDGVQAANTAAIQKVIAALQSSGIASKDIATDWYMVEPLYDNYDSLYIKGYRINNTVAVTLREVSKTSATIAAAVKAGANQVVNVEFYTSQLRTYRDQARDLAMKAAGEKARALADAAGAQTGCVLHISEDSWSYYNGSWYARNQNLWTQNTVQNAAPSGSGSQDALGEAGPVSLGQISVQARVDVTYSLK
jgi:hypothetical protein